MIKKFLKIIIICLILIIALIFIFKSKSKISFDDTLFLKLFQSSQEKSNDNSKQNATKDYYEFNVDSKTEKIQYDQDIILALDGIQDPGNLGTILRTADSVNLKQIIVTKTTADSYNPKVVRSTMGAILRVKVIETDDLVATLRKINSKLL